MSNLVKFKKLSIQNFKSFGPKIDFDFSKHYGLNYIFGTNKDIEGTSNGAGKSNVFDALMFALFGKTINNTNNRFLPNRVITNKKMITDVILDFEVNNNLYRVRSFIKHRYHPYIVGCQLWENGTDDKHEITKASSRDTRKYIEKQILKCSYDLFKSSVILSSSDARNFFKMSKNQKRDYIENIFELTVFGDMFSILKQDVNKLGREILLVQNDCNQQKDSINDFKVKENEFDNNQINTIKQLTIQAKLKKQQASDLKLELSEEDLQNNCNITENIYLQKISRVNEGKIKIQSVLRRLNDNIKNYQREVAKHDEVLQIICDDCKNKINQKYNLDDIHRKVETMRNRITEYDKKLQSLEMSKIKLNKKSIEVEEGLKKCKQIKDEIEHNKWVKTQLIKEVKELVERVKIEKNKISPFKELIEKYQKELDDKQNTLDRYYQDKMYLEALVHVVSEDGAKKYIIKDLVDILNQLIRKYLEEMGAEYTCVFDTNFDVTFLTNTGECEYSSFSAGERARLIISTLFAFRDILISTGGFESNIFVIDELIDANVDNYCIQSLINILNKQVEEKNTTIFIISHRETIRPEDFDNIIEVQKANSVTTIVNDPQGGISNGE